MIDTLEWVKKAVRLDWKNRVTCFRTQFTSNLRSGIIRDFQRHLGWISITTADVSETTDQYLENNRNHM